MASTAALRRIKKEYGALEKEPAPGAVARPLETNFLHAHFLLSGHVFHDTPYEGGVYHGVLKFPTNYPMKPPTVIMRTPSGRFQPDQKICFSMSDFHPESWNPSWSIRTILVGLTSFMNSDEITTGGVSATAAVRAAFAQKSLKFCVEKDPLAKELFGSELDELMKDRATLGDSWPPTRKAVVEVKPTVSSKSTPASRRLASAKKRQATKAKEEEQPPPDSSSAPGKNAAKNKKKREKEKRKKLSKKFLTTLSEQVPKFLSAMVIRLKETHNMDVSNYHADHVCWRTETMEEYSDLIEALNSATNDCTLLIESKIGGRSIATFGLTSGIQVGDRTVDVIEIPAPKDGSPYQTGLEHVEFVIADSNNSPSTPLNNECHQRVLGDFIKQHPGCDWNLKAKDKDINPDVSLKIELDEFGVSSVKFHLMPLAKVIEYEKKNGYTS